MAVTEKWVGRSPMQIIEDGVSGSTDLYLLKRSQGKSADKALEEVCKQYGYGLADGLNVRRLAETFRQAEERERQGIVARRAKPETFVVERQAYQVCRRGRRMSRRESVDYVATRYRHGPANRPHLEKALAEVEERYLAHVPDPPQADTSQRIEKLEAELAELRRSVVA